jgi:dihydrofolate reductase
MRQLRYSVAMSLDGFIAGAHGEYDWITFDASMDFVALFEQFDTLLMGRLTYEVALIRSQFLKSMGKKIVVVSATLDPAQHPGVTIIPSDAPAAVAALKKEKGKDIWLMGGGVLFRTLLDAQLVDTVEVHVFPILLGSGVQVVPSGRRAHLELKECTSLPSGILMLSYAVKTS